MKTLLKRVLQIAIIGVCLALFTQLTIIVLVAICLHKLYRMGEMEDDMFFVLNDYKNGCITQVPMTFVSEEGKEILLIDVKTDRIDCGDYHYRD